MDLKSFSEKIKSDLIIKTLKRLFKGRNDIYLVGGAVRDYLLERKPKEYDFVSKKPYETSKFVAKALNLKFFPLGKGKFRVYRIPLSDGGLDFTSIRTRNIINNLKKRDFTIDAIAVRINDFKLVDPNSGIEDLKKGILRKGYNKSFEDDPLRVVKGYRLKTTFPQIEWDKTTKDDAIKFSKKIVEAKKERIKEELIKLFSERQSSIALKEMWADGILFQVFPTLREIEGLPQSKPHKNDVLNHTLDMLFILDENLPFFDNFTIFFQNKKDIIKLKLSILFHDSGKGRCFFKDKNGIHFYNHQKESASIAQKTLSSLAFPNAICKSVANLCYLHIVPLQLFKEENRSLKARRRLIHKAKDDFPLLVFLSYIDFTSMDRSDEEIEKYKLFCQELLSFYKEKGNKIVQRKKLIDGNEAKEILGIGDGPLLGKALNKVLTAQIEGKIKNKKEAVNFLKKLRGNIGKDETE